MTTMSDEEKQQRPEEAQEVQGTAQDHAEPARGDEAGEPSREVEVGMDGEKPRSLPSGTSLLTGTEGQELSKEQEAKKEAGRDEEQAQEQMPVPDIAISRPSVSAESSVPPPPPPPTGDQSTEEPAREEQREESTEANGKDHHEGGEDAAPPTPAPKEEEEGGGGGAPTRPDSDTSATPSVAPSSAVDASRRSSVASSTTTAVHSRSSLSSLNKGSAVFVISALEQISTSREAKGSKGPAKELREAAQRALDMVRASSSTSQNGHHAPAPGSELDPRVVFEPLRLACATRSTNLVVTSLDCLGKLVSYSFFAEDVPSNPSEEALADVVTSTVCDAFYEGLDDRAQLQIIKALLAVVLSSSVHVHQSSLMKAVRTVYNIFLLSKSASTQAVAQGVLTQMVHHVFGRVPTRRRAANEEEANTSMSSSSSSSSVSGAPGGLLSPPHQPKTGSRKLRAPEEDADEREMAFASVPPSNGQVKTTDDEGEEDVPLDDDDKMAAAQGDETIAADGKGANGGSEEAPPAEKVTLRTLESRASFEGASEKDTGAKLMAQSQMSQAELSVKDAFLVLRALCKLSMKPLGTERYVAVQTVLPEERKCMLTFLCPANEISSHKQCGPSF